MQTENYLIRKSSLEKLFNNLIVNGKTIFAPKAKGELALFAKVQAFEEITEDYIVTANSAKSVVFPRAEKVFSYKKTKESTEISDAANKSFPDVVLWGTRPCDAAAFIPLNNTFNEDYPDVIYNKRSQKVLVLSFSCSKCDSYCFCTSVNGGPGNTTGSDILFTKLSSGDYLVEVITEKGKLLVTENSTLFESKPEESKEQNLAQVTTYFNQDEIQAKLQNLFENPVWDEKSRACLGCGSCAYVCPVCSCFDIQDEAHGSKGSRLRCWDSCGFGLFTLHTSGHNPRETQGARWRQRILHKFLYMPNKSKVAGCVGCGRCSRACPADINILETVCSI
jgi:formate hydrogenlyase subunit 6/NADH:ubiquinone oxidoreductase subunit I